MQAPNAGTSLNAKLARLQTEYAALKQKLLALDFVCQGSVLSRRTLCGQSTCRCHTDPDARHGPYWELTYKVRGKTVARRITDAEAPLYLEASAAFKSLKAIVAQMTALSRRALQQASLSVTQVTNAPPVRKTTRKQGTRRPR